jgi:hypothetical protein
MPKTNGTDDMSPASALTRLLSLSTTNQGLRDFIAGLSKDDLYALGCELALRAADKSPRPFDRRPSPTGATFDDVAHGPDWNKPPQPSSAGSKPDPVSGPKVDDSTSKASDVIDVTTGKPIDLSTYQNGPYKNPWDNYKVVATTYAECPPAPTATDPALAPGTSPWMSDPTIHDAWSGNDSSVNPLYFATKDYADALAGELGGTVEAKRISDPANDGGFSPNEPMYYVRLANGQEINAGVYASIYAHGYSPEYAARLAKDAADGTTSSQDVRGNWTTKSNGPPPKLWDWGASDVSGRATPPSTTDVSSLDDTANLPDYLASYLAKLAHG